MQEELGDLSEKQQQLVTTLELIRLEEFLSKACGLPGRPPADRTAITRAVVAKTVFNLPTTRALIDRLESDPQVRRICGRERKEETPGEWTFSRAFAEFSKSRLPERVHEALKVGTQIGGAEASDCPLTASQVEQELDLRHTEWVSLGVPGLEGPAGLHGREDVDQFRSVTALREDRPHAILFAKGLELADQPDR